MAHQDPVQDAEARAHYVSDFGYITQTGRLTDGPADSDMDQPPLGLARSYAMHDTLPTQTLHRDAGVAPELQLWAGRWPSSYAIRDSSPAQYTTVDSAPLFFPFDPTSAPFHAAPEASHSRGPSRSINIPGVTHDFLDGRPFAMDSVMRAEITAAQARLLDANEHSTIQPEQNALGEAPAVREEHAVRRQAATREILRLNAPRE